MCIRNALLLFLCAALVSCSSGGDGPPDPGSSLRSPLPGSIVGNWVITEVGPNPSVTPAIQGNVRVRPGMNIRISPSGVEVLVDEYVGPGTMLPDIMTDVFGGEYEFKQFPVSNGVGYAVDLILDYSSFISMKPRSIYTHVSAQLVLDGNRLRVTFRVEDYVPDNATPIEWNDVELICDGGNDLAPIDGEWRLRDLVVLQDSSPDQPFVLPVPYRRPALDDTLVFENGRLHVLGTPLEVSAFAARFPEFQVLQNLVLTENGVLQGFQALVGDAVSPAPGVGIVSDFSFFNTGPSLQGDLRIVWGVGEIYHAYLVFQRGPVLPSGRSWLWRNPGIQRIR